MFSVGIHFGEFFLGREVYFELSWPRGFFIVLSAGIHLGEFFLGREVYFELFWPRGFLLYSRQGFTWVNSSLAERFL